MATRREFPEDSVTSQESGGVSLTGTIRWAEISGPPIPQPARLSALPRGLANAVARLEYAIGRHGSSTERATPSAGACYPYELLIAPSTGQVVGLVDPHQRLVVTTNADHSLWDGTDFAYFLVGRPWFALRKYGRRGYLYHLLDAGHAMLNLALVSGPSIQDTSGRGGMLLATGAMRAADRSEPTGRWLLKETSAIQPPPSDIEEVANSILPATPPAVVLDVDTRPYRDQLTAGIASRRSAVVFEGGLRANVVEDLTSECVERCERLIPRFGLPVPGVRIVSRQPGPGVRLPADEWVTNALVGQSQLAGASAFLVIHGQVRDGSAQALSVDAQRTAIAAGIAGEIVYLTAAQAGVAVTGIGGFDPARWTRLCGTTDEILYVLAIGSDVGGEKFDATNPNGSHG